MSTILKLQPIDADLCFKMTVLKSMMYCGVLWGLYHPDHQGWAMTADENDYIFPFWLSANQADRYAAQRWPTYRARRISPKDFEDSLMPTLTRLNVTPALYNTNSQKIKLTTIQMKHFFFSTKNLQFA